MSSWLKFVLFVFAFSAGCQQSLEDEQKDNINERILKAKNCIADNHFKDAIKILEEGLSIHGNVLELIELLANAYLRDGNDELAAFHFEQIAALSDLHYHCYLNAAEIYEKMENYDRALLSYRCYLKVLPEDKEVQIKYVDVLYHDGQKKKALKILVHYAEESVEICNRVAALFFDFGNYIQARNWYLSALAMDKNSLPALKGLFEVGLLFKDWNALFEVGTKLLALGEKSFEGLSIRDIVDAIKIFQKESNELKNMDLDFEKIALPIFISEAIKPKFPPLMVQRTDTIEEIVTKQKKIAALKDSAEKARSRGDYEEAILILWKMLGMDGKNVEAWVALTECLQRTSKYDIAEMAIQEAIKFKPECVDFYMTYLDIVLCTHSTSDYMQLLKNVKHRFSTNPEIRLRWANAQEMYMDNAKGAKHSYEKFLKLAPPNHPEVFKVKYLLQTYDKEEDNGRK